MKQIIAVLILAGLGSCQEPSSLSEFTGFETTYELSPGSEYAVSGTVSFKERTDGFTTVSVNLNGTEGDVKFPVHLHLGNISTPQADVAALLSPVVGKTGLSETILTNLADETPIKYADLVNIEACIKIHLSDTGEGRDIILAGGNIGLSYTKSIASGRQQGFSVCKSE